MPQISSIRIWTAVGLAALLAGCGVDEDAVREMAKERGYTKVEFEAFLVCAKDLRRNKPVFPVAKGNLRMNEVPLEVCACQAKTITAVFKEDKFANHAKFAEYMATQRKKKARISKKAILGGLTPIAAQDKLSASLTTCVEDYRNGHKEEAADLFELLPPLPEKKKKKIDENKTAEAST